MAKNWDAQVRSFLEKTRVDLHRAAENVKSEAQRLLAEVKEPPVRERLETQLRDLRMWAKKTAEEVRSLLEKGLRQNAPAKKKGKKTSASRKRPARKPKTPAKSV